MRRRNYTGAMQRHPRIIGDLVAGLVAQHGSVKAVAYSFGVHYSQVSQMARGKLRPNRKMLKALGFRKVELYIPEESPLPAVGYPYKAEA